MAGKPGRSGGARPGAGRKPKPPEVRVVNGDTPLEFLEAVMKDTGLDIVLRVRAAGLAAQYRHAKKGEGGKGQEKSEAAKKAAEKFASPAPPKLVVDNR